MKIPKFARQAALIKVALGLCLTIAGANGHRLTASKLLASETYSLRPEQVEPLPTTVEGVLEVGGHLVVVGEHDKEQQIPMSVVAKYRYDEQRLDDGSQPNHRMALRHYDVAEAVIKVGGEMSKPQLRESHRLICATSNENSAHLSSTTGPLFREELDMLEIPGNTLLLDQILPEKAVEVGQKWKISDDLLVRLLCLDAVANAETQAELVAVKDGIAEILVEGPLSGAVRGVAAQIELKGKLLYDINHKRPQEFILAVKENRGIGHVGPGLDVVAKIKLDFSEAAASKLLDSELLKSAALPSSDAPPVLEYRDDALGYRLTHDPRWHITREEPHLLVMRLIDRGELVAQCNVAPATKKLEKAVTLVQFQNDVQAALGKSFSRFERAAERTTPSGLRVLQSIALGTANELPIQWRYYLVHDQEGRAVTIIFAMEGPLAEQFGDLDEPIVNSIEFIEPKLAKVLK